MTLLVQKFGGTSVKDTECIEFVANKIKSFYERNVQLVIVISAMAGETDRLFNLAQTFLSQQNDREHDMLLSTGEQVTAALLAMALNKLNCPAISLTGQQAGIVTNDQFNKARIQFIDVKKIHYWLEKKKIIVVTGFQGVDNAGHITTLGRGGSDTTAVALAAALQANECQIYTDVDGVFTADPRIVEKARKLNTVTFEEMLEIASLGSKVLHSRSVEFAGKYKTNLRVLNTFKEGPGTLINFSNHSKMEQPIISSIAYSRNEAKITLLNIIDQPGMAFNILKVLAKNNIDVDMIIYSSTQDNLTDLTFTVNHADYKKSLALFENNTALDKIRVEAEDTVAKVSIVGVGMQSHPGVAAKMFETLAKENINIKAITTSEIKISILIHEKYTELAVRALHTAFGLDITDFEVSE